jgi:hypothetical protein
MRPAMDRVFEARRKSDGTALSAVNDRLLLYAALAFSDDAEFVTRAVKPVIVDHSDSAAEPASILPLTGAVLLNKSPGERIVQSLRELVEKHAQTIRGDDAVMLVALACRKLGGETWEAFRVQQSGITAAQQLDGGVVVLINRLARAPKGIWE